MNRALFLIVALVLVFARLSDAGVEVVLGEKQDLREPFSIVFDEAGALYGVEYENGGRVFTLGKDGAFSVLSGAREPAGKKRGDIARGDGGPASGGRFNGMHDLAISPTGTIYVADTFNNRVRVIAKGTIATFAGTGGKGAFAGEGERAGKASFDGPHTVTLNKDATRLLIADLGNRRVREIDLKTKMIRTVAGNGKRGIPEDGTPATKAPLVAPRAACYGADGSIFIASREGHALRQVRLDGTIHTVVNAAGSKGYAGDGGPGVTAKLNGPKHLALGPDGSIVISDDNNQCIRAYDPKTGKINLLAGIPGKKGDKIGKGPLDTELNRPHGARYDGEGNLYVADSFNHRVLKFTK